MPKVAKYLGAGGATYKNGYSTTPMCCPSRSSLLTGKYFNKYSGNHVPPGWDEW